MLTPLRGSSGTHESPGPIRSAWELSLAGAVAPDIWRPPYVCRDPARSTVPTATAALFVDLPSTRNDSALTDPAPSPSVDALKADLRRRAKAARREASLATGADASEAMARHGIAFAERPAPAIVSGFIAIGDEIDLVPLMARLENEGYRLALPVMEGKGKPLVFRAWSPGEPLSQTMWGIREPLPAAETVDPDIVLSPLLAFDMAGYRLGYGGGFYDRTLARLRALKPIVSIGIAYDEQRVDAVPRLDYDERLDWILTPSGPMKCGSE